MYKNNTYMEIHVILFALVLITFLIYLSLYSLAYIMVMVEVRRR